MVGDRRMTLPVTPHRTLDAAFLDVLEKLANEDNGNWWRDVLRHPDIVLAVRRNSINAYYRGSSIFRIDWKAGQVIPFTHVKYLVRQAQSYVPLRDGCFDIAGNPLQSAYQGLDTLNEMCKAASLYAGPEKAGLHPMLVGNANVIDTEIALTRLSASEPIKDDEEADLPDRKQDRIDAAIAVVENDVPTIRFYEAKHFNNPALRAGSRNRPDVVRQVADYGKALFAYNAELSAGYIETAKALLRFNDMRVQAFGESFVRCISPAIRQIAEAEQAPVIDMLPHLIIYGFDKAQRDDPDWGRHLDKLKAALPGRVRTIGKPKRRTAFVR